MLTLLTRSQFRVLSSSKSSRFLRIPAAFSSPQFCIKPSRPARAPSSYFKPQPRTLSVAANHSFSTTTTSRILSKMAPIKKDPNSQANHLVFTTTHTDINLILSFPTSSLSGDVTLALKATEDTLEDVVLDTSYLDVKSVCVDGEKATFDVSERVEPYGSALTINTGKEVKEGQCIKVKISYGTTDRCTALQWMTPEQTSNKKHPYMFSQCQAIHARSLYPCQDTPAVKSPFDIKIRSPLPVLTSGLPTGTREFIAGNSKDEAGTLLYTSHQSIPIPSYLFAIASGDIASASIGPRSLVYTGPEELLACKTELEGDMEKFMEAAESLVYPYPWTTYNVLILPPSFPYGGMENPTHTFATPTIISGDKSNIDVIAHELSHSWSGNLVSNASWEHFWLNEGWTTYLERRIAAILHGDKEFHFSAIIGWKALKESVQLYGEDHEFTKLVVDLEGKDPDDAFSSIPYEKGFNFLFFLDRVVGRAKWDKFIPHYFKKFHQKSLTSEDFKSTLLEFFASDAEASAALKKEVDWEKWFHAPGLPPKPDFDTSLADVCYSLADKWHGLNTDSPISGGWTPGPKDIESWTSGQIVVFLEKITDFEKPLKPELVETMINQYGFMKSKNAEILSRMLIVGLKAKDPKLFQPAAEALGTWGRMKFVRPLYRLLNECDRELAVKTFKAHINFYHPICRDAVKKDLKLD